MTDFGHKDPFVGIMKGVILGINPSAQLVDIHHDVDPGDIRGVAFGLAMAFPYFPAGTIFLAVVDPGVGSNRRAIAARIADRFVVCPDNGILTWVLKHQRVQQSVELNKSEYFLPEVSDTFHGRDIFAPVAAHLSKGVSLEDMGSPVTDLMTFAVPEVVAADRSVQGEVVYVDRFGNLITNISREQLAPWQGKSGFGPVRIHVGSAEIEGIARVCGDVPKGKPLALFGSAGYLEMAVNGGSALSTLAAPVGARILVYKLPEQKA